MSDRVRKLSVRQLAVLSQLLSAPQGRVRNVALVLPHGARRASTLVQLELANLLVREATETRITEAGRIAFARGKYGPGITTTEVQP